MTLHLRARPAVARPPPSRVIKQGERPFRDLPEFTFWALLHEIADRQQGPLRRRFLEAVQAAEGSIDQRALEDALAGGDFEAALALLPFERFERELLLLAGPVEAASREASTATAIYLTALLAGASDAEAVRAVRQDRGPSPALLLALDGAFLVAVRAAQREATEIARRVGGDTRLTLRAGMARSLEAGLPPGVAASEARLLLGLTPRHATAVQNFRLGLLERGIPPERIERLTATYAARLRRWRARNLARTQAGDAASFGQQLLWGRAVRQGTLDPTVWEREWVAIVPSDGRTCIVCQTLDGKRAAIGEPYEGGFMGPRAHFSCRCEERLVRRESPQRTLSEEEMVVPDRGRDLRPRVAA